ncbi:hypothetical protein ACFL2V_20885, partial [Pseudomonadota bacterium]
SSGTKKFFSGVAFALKPKRRSKQRVCLAARAQRRLRVSVVSSHVQSGREQVSNRALNTEKRNVLKEAINKFKGATLNYEFGTSTIIGSLAVVAIVTSLMYLAHFNQVATKGYELKRLEADHQQLLNQYEIKNMRLAEAMSLTRITETDRISAMRKANSVTFLTDNTVLASK